MQYSLPFAVESPITRVHQRLCSAFGVAFAFRRLDPVSQMVLAILSARTRNAISKQVFESLANRFFRWDELAKLPESRIEKLIRRVTFAERKAHFLPRALQGVMRKRGQLELEFLDEWPVAAAQRWLERLPGVGPKTSTAVLNLSTLRKCVLVVDTAHWRVARRLGLVPASADLAKTSRLLNRQLPEHWTADDAARHHAYMQHLGHICCTHTRPTCSLCPLRNLCPYPASPDLQLQEGIARETAIH